MPVSSLCLTFFTLVACLAFTFSILSWLSSIDSSNPFSACSSWCRISLSPVSLNVVIPRSRISLALSMLIVLSYWA